MVDTIAIPRGRRKRRVDTSRRQRDETDQFELWPGTMPPDGVVSVAVAASLSLSPCVGTFVPSRDVELVALLSVPISPSVPGDWLVSPVAAAAPIRSGLSEAASVCGTTRVVAAEFVDCARTGVAAKARAAAMMAVRPSAVCVQKFDYS